MSDNVRCALCGENVPKIRNNCQKHCTREACVDCSDGEFVCGLCALKMSEHKAIRAILMERRREKLFEVREIEKRLGMPPGGDDLMYV